MKKINSLLAFVLMFTIALSSTSPIYADDISDATNIQLQVNNPIMTVDGQEKAIDETGTTPIIQSGRTILPVRAVVEAMGGNVSWNSDSQTATLTYGEHEIKLTIESTTAYVNGEVQTLDVSPVIINGRTMLPIRFIAEAFDFEVVWTDEGSTITITKEVEKATDDSTTENPEAADIPKSVIEQTDKKILIAYFTMPESNGVDAVAGASRVIVDNELLGNTQYIANVIEESTGGALFEIKTTQTYPGDHDELVDFADDEKSKNERPTLSTKIDNLDDYDIIFIGYPIWWADLPMPLYTFLDEYDFSGKTVVPFSTHGGSGFADTIRIIARLQPNANVITKGFTVSRSSTAMAKNDVKSWLDSLESDN